MPPQYVQRLRLTYRKFGPTRFIGHLDVARTWERALNRTAVPVSYSQGFNRRPRMQFAAPLPLGYTSDVEMVDIWLRERLEPAVALDMIRARMAPGIEATAAQEVLLTGPSLPSLVQDATYLISFLAGEEPPADLGPRVADFLAADSVWRTRQDKRYDLRPLVTAATVLARSGVDEPCLTVRVFLTPHKSGRPDEFVAALGLDPLAARYHRSALTLSEAHDAAS